MNSKRINTDDEKTIIGNPAKQPVVEKSTKPQFVTAPMPPVETKKFTTQTGQPANIPPFQEPPKESLPSPQKIINKYFIFILLIGFCGTLFTLLRSPHSESDDIITTSQISAQPPSSQNIAIYPQNAKSNLVEQSNFPTHQITHRMIASEFGQYLKQSIDTAK